MERMRKWMSAVGIAFVILALPATAKARRRVRPPASTRRR